MKYLVFIALLAVASLPNCKKEHIIIKTPEPIDTTVQHVIDFGQSSVLKNGVLWNVPYRAFYAYLTKKRFSLKGGKTYPNGLRETAFITDIPLFIGRHTIRKEILLSDFNNGIPDAGYTMTNYDEGIGNFYPDTTRTDNFIEVLRFDTITNEVEGRFQVFMGERDAPTTLPGVPDSIFFTAGKFYLKLQ